MGDMAPVGQATRRSEGKWGETGGKWGGMGENGREMGEKNGKDGDVWGSPVEKWCKVGDTQEVNHASG